MKSLKEFAETAREGVKRATNSAASLAGTRTLKTCRVSGFIGSGSRTQDICMRVTTNAFVTSEWNEPALSSRCLK